MNTLAKWSPACSNLSQGPEITWATEETKMADAGIMHCYHSEHNTVTYLVELTGRDSYIK